MASASAPTTASARRRARKAAPAQTAGPDTVEPTVVQSSDDTMGYDLSRYDDVVVDPVDEAEAPTDIAPGTNGRLAGTDDPDAAGDDKDGDLAEASTSAGVVAEAGPAAAPGRSFPLRHCPAHPLWRPGSGVSGAGRAAFMNAR